jgi:hypothetical protein
MSFSEFGIRDGSNKNDSKSFSNFAHYYQSPSGYNASNRASSYLTGCARVNATSCYFSTAEIEVFQLFNKSSSTASSSTTTTTSTSTTTATPTTTTTTATLTSTTTPTTTSTTAASTSAPMSAETIVNSTILNSLEIQKIYSQFSSNQTFQLLYRATRDNSSAAAFHSKCDSHFNTLTIIQSVYGYVFGGFASLSWTSCDCYKTDSSAFILSLRRNVAGFNVTTDARRFNVTSPTYAILDKSDFGPSFGGGYDLYLSDMSSISNNSYCKLGNSYQYPSGYDAFSINASNYLTGCMDNMGICKFSTAEIEVYQLI